MANTSKTRTNGAYLKRKVSDTAEQNIKRGIAPPPTLIELTDRQMYHYYTVVTSKAESLWIDSARSLAVHLAMDLDLVERLYIKLQELMAKDQDPAATLRQIDMAQNRIRLNMGVLQIRPTVLNGSQSDQQNKNTAHRQSLEEGGVNADNFQMTQHQRVMKLIKN
jgi:hypothetical protein